LGSGGVSAGTYESAQEGNIVWSRRETVAEIMSDELSLIMGLVPGEPVDRWLHVSWQAPANLVLYAGAVPTGLPKGEGREGPSVHLFTPETNATSHYWYGFSLPKAMGEIAEKMAIDQTKFLEVPFTTEDLPMLEAQQRNLGSRSLDDIKPVWLPGDAAGSRARQILARMIADEQK
jgi:vanillate O-demethylase monooxygenase subunit